jgi:hypothetical protein
VPAWHSTPALSDQPAEDVRRIGYQPAGAWREAPRAKRALRKSFGISMPFSVLLVISCRLLALAAMGRPRGAAFRAQKRLWGARFARTDACSGGLRAQAQAYL